MRINLLPKKRTFLTWFSERTLTDLLFIPFLPIALLIYLIRPLIEPLEWISRRLMRILMKGLVWLADKLKVFLAFLNRRLIHHCPLHELPLMLEWRPVNTEKENRNEDDLFDARKYFPYAYVVYSISNFAGKTPLLETVKYCPKCRTEQRLYIQSPLRHSEFDDPRKRFDVSSDWEHICELEQHPQRIKVSEDEWCYDSWLIHKNYFLLWLIRLWEKRKDAN